MPFGLTTSPSTFQALMNDVFRDYVDKFMLVYLDDVLIFSRSAEEHKEHVELV
jgi:Reverse transcriptase (RNA-dependent DNA polymerase)